MPDPGAGRDGEPAPVGSVGEVPDRTGAPAPDVVLDGRYRLQDLIARGGMAEVWRARDDVLGRPVAVKVLLPNLAADSSFRERFRLEAISAARLSHPHVVTTFDTGLDGGLAYIVMELVECETLRELLARGPLAPARAVEIGAQVADALEYAHRAGIVHRDVKPANILVCPDDQVKVADFGIAKAVLESDGAADLTQTGAVLGTAKYLSPEQVEGRPLDGRSDVYSLGVVLYEMVCGRPPFTGDTEMALGFQHISRPPPSMRQVRPGIPHQLEAVVMRTLDKSPEQRYASAKALRAALLAADLDAAAPAPPAPAGSAPPRGAAPPPGTAPPPPAFDDHTPAGGVRVLARPRRRWGRLVVPLGLLLAMGVALALLSVTLRSEDRPSTPGTAAPGDSAVEVASFDAFDPGGDGAEHDDELRLLTDGNPNTSWTSQRYASSRFGNLKPGVGFVVRLEGRQKLSQLRLRSPNRGWAAEVMVSDRAHSTREGWGRAVARREGIAGDATFDLGGAAGSAVLVWITDLGEGNLSARISEMELSG